MDDFTEGASTAQCNKIIEKIAGLRKKEVKYTSFKSPKQMIEFIVNNKKGKFLLNSDEHLCYLRNGKLLDSFYDGDRKRLTEDRILGYWEIKEPIKEDIIGSYIRTLRNSYSYSASSTVTTK